MGKFATKKKLWNSWHVFIISMHSVPPTTNFFHCVFTPLLILSWFFIRSYSRWAFNPGEFSFSSFNVYCLVLWSSLLYYDLAMKPTIYGWRRSRHSSPSSPLSIFVFFSSYRFWLAFAVLFISFVYFFPCGLERVIFFLFSILLFFILVNDDLLFIRFTSVIINQW